jgi:EAL domain-containing protein (putative c-di-GMP-specific phosphodiesterase class I)
MGHSLGKIIVAEGVESKDQYEFLTRHKCEGAQGYFFSKPVSSEDFKKLVASERSLVATYH